MTSVNFLTLHQSDPKLVPGGGWGSRWGPSQSLGEEPSPALASAWSPDLPNPAQGGALFAKMEALQSSKCSFPV